MLVCCSSALATCGSPVVTGSTATVTCTAGSGQSVSVPANHVGGVTLEAIGGDGGSSQVDPNVSSGGGARGSYAKAGAFTLTVDVGTAGVDGIPSSGAGGTPGGGAGDAGQFGGGGGGGYSQIVDGATPVIIAGGGGGAGSSGQFGIGGDGAGGADTWYPDGQPGGGCIQPPESNCLEISGHGATTTAPGAGESETSVSGHIDGQPGSGRVGGAAGAATGGGGGGGGCFGGGGGGTTVAGIGGGGGGGGGGSTCVDASLTNVSEPLGPGGDGVVVVSWTTPTPPAITSAGTASFTLGTNGTFTITSSGNPDATISLDDPADLPAGLSFTAGAGGTGVISGTPTGSPSSVIVHVNADNGVGTADDEPLTINVTGTVTPAPVPASITSTGPAKFTIGTAGSYAITAAGSPTPVISLDDPADLPAGLKFTGGTGSASISGTPTGSAGSFSVTVRAVAGAGPDATQKLTIEVAAPPGTQSSGGGFVDTGGAAGPPVTTTPSGTVGVTLGCAGATGTTCTGQVAVSVRERLRGSKVIGVAARAKRTTRTVKVGVARYTIAAGNVKVVKVALNRTGRALLKRFHHLKVKVVVAVTTSNGLSQAATRTVTLRQPAKKRKK
jgi:hypothetical protein